ncbi:hypothetical protein A2U01_0072780 [Trifolium medium]|uniref:Uncharacterized protein n=1 Tax=Trifolium medium TaxID=97028 RepID=A0A392SUJ3_9FABA|nr:hypothetical protein [Trifolium medium]
MGQKQLFPLVSALCAALPARCADNRQQLQKTAAGLCLAPQAWRLAPSADRKFKFSVFLAILSPP